MNLAIITARSGSKGIKDKNIKLICGKPLMAYTIDTAYGSEIFDEVYVSTDSEKYAEVAKAYGASVPFLRSSQNADDNASSWDVVKETLKKYKELGKVFDAIALLQPTSPLRITEDIKNSYKLFREKNANSVIGVCETEHSPLLCNRLDQNLSMENFINRDIYQKLRQNLPKYYRINGAIYFVKTKYDIDICDLYDEKCYAYIMPQERSIDIDTELDFELAERLLEKIY